MVNGINDQIDISWKDADVQNGILPVSPIITEHSLQPESKEKCVSSVNVLKFAL